jgi:hypothetical protein
VQVRPGRKRRQLTPGPVDLPVPRPRRRAGWRPGPWAARGGRATRRSSRAGWR